MTPFTDWQNFYVILGTAAAALTGLQFISMALIADMSMQPGEAEAGNQAFATPAVVHFVAILLLSASMVMPWQSLHYPFVLWITGGLIGAAYSFSITRVMRRQIVYKPIFEDWLFRAVFPVTCYLAFAIAAAFLPRYPRPALFAIAATALLLLLLAIHHTWDNVTYLVYIKRHQSSNQP